ncbi:MAG: hypothetical protein KDA74_08425, partial [Planctomycetaceae bacterium]|nr:hypothetical protein [Planctomycetaceae bacterium]
MKTPRLITASVSVLTVFAALVCLSLDLQAQQNNLEDFFNQKKAAAADAGVKTEINVSLLPQDAKAGDTVTLSIAVILPEGAYTYSTNPTFGGATKFKIDDTKGLTAIDQHFNADHPPKT